MTGFYKGKLRYTTLNLRKAIINLDINLKEREGGTHLRLRGCRTPVLKTGITYQVLDQFLGQGMLNLI